MISRERRTVIFIEAGILVLIVYFFSVFLNGFLDEMRLDDFDSKLRDVKVDYESMVVSDFFFDVFSEGTCSDRKRTIFNSLDALEEMGEGLESYGGLFLDSNSQMSEIRMREFFLRELVLYEDVLRYNENCGEDVIVPVLYFFNGRSDVFDKQAVVLDQFVSEYENKSVVFSFDFFYEDEPLLYFLKDYYSIDFLPFFVFGNFTSRDFGCDGSFVVEEDVLVSEFLRFRGEV